MLKIPFHKNAQNKTVEICLGTFHKSLEFVKFVPIPRQNSLNTLKNENQAKN